MKIVINNNYINPENYNVEIVERKGIGHPDNLADKLAMECSREYSRYTYEKYGVILHHNLDKLYIGSGLFLLKNKKIVRKKKILVVLNGRVSTEMNGEQIDLNSIFIPVIHNYMKSVMPRINPEKDLKIVINCNNFSKRDYWYKPRDINDIPDVNNLLAADTALCVLHNNRTFCETLCYEVEHYFWSQNENGYPKPKFDDVGQDIKVMVKRLGNNIDVTVCLPIFKDLYNTYDQYTNIVEKYEKDLSLFVKKIYNKNNYKISINVNRKSDGTRDVYALVKGSCIECGEEGVVGRGNDYTGLICSFRTHSIESPFGKNERYHTGRIMNYLGYKAITKINKELNVNADLYILNRSHDNLFEPLLFLLSVDDISKRDKCIEIINNIVNEKNINNILYDKDLY